MMTFLLLFPASRHPRHLGPLLILLLLLSASYPGAAAAMGRESAGDDWNHWRGPEATGAAPDATPPLTWSETENIKWKVPIPGRGHATPVISKNRIFVLTSVDTGEPVDGEADRPHRGIAASNVQEFTVIALDRDSGKELWRRVARRSVPPAGTHPDGTWASGSPATDGEYVIADFGSSGVYCYDVEGNLQWQHDLGDMGTHGGFGEGSSPAIYGEIVVVLFDHTGQSFIAGFDRKTGTELWRTNRDESASWSTPLVIEVEGKPQVVTNGTLIRAYDLYSGELIWECAGMTGNATATPVFADGLLYVASGFNGAAAVAIRPAGARGNITDTPAVVWTYDKDTPYVPSPLLYGEYLYFLKIHNGILSCLKAGDGTVVYGPQRLPGLDSVFASPVGAAGRVYIAGRNGTVLVIKHGPSFEVMATNKIEDELYASPIMVGDRVYLRGTTHLYCITGN
jgi:outer membrane protein assembly factor BamB